MDTKKIIKLLTLTTNLYIIAKDKEFFESLSNLVKKGKEAFSESPEDGEESEEDLIQQLIQKATEAKEEIEKKMEEIAVGVYDKMHIAHTNEIERLEKQIEELKKELLMAEGRIFRLENPKSSE